MSERGLRQIVEESAECPLCSACPGEPCSDVYDMVVDPHDERIRAAGFDPNMAQNVVDLMGVLRASLKPVARRGRGRNR